MKKTSAWMRSNFETRYGKQRSSDRLCWQSKHHAQNTLQHSPIDRFYWTLLSIAPLPMIHRFIFSSKLHAALLWAVIKFPHVQMFFVYDFVSVSWKALAAELTSVLLFARVYGFMQPQIIGIAEGFWTFRAFIGRFSSVNSFVFFESEWVIKGGRTKPTHKSLLFHLFTTIMTMHS